jgi:hypothetical protein
LLALVANFMVFNILKGFPLTTQGSAWYAGISLTGILLMAAMAFYGFYTSLGGRPMFGGAVLEEWTKLVRSRRLMPSIPTESGANSEPSNRTHDCRISDHLLAFRYLRRKQFSARKGVVNAHHACHGAFSALSAPLRFSSERLPIDVQLVSKWFDKATILRFGEAIEAANEFRIHHPNL